MVRSAMIIALCVALPLAGCSGKGHLGAYDHQYKVAKGEDIVGLGVVALLLPVYLVGWALHDPERYKANQAAEIAVVAGTRSSWAHKDARGYAEPVGEPYAEAGSPGEPRQCRKIREVLARDGAETETETQFCQRSDRWERA